MKRKSIIRKIERKPAEIARLKELRAKYQREKPSLASLVAPGEFAPPIKQGELLAKLTSRAQNKRAES